MLIDQEGTNHGEVSVKDARQMAEERELDLLLMDPKQKLPVCRIGDYGKYLYQSKKKDHNQKKTQIKEMRFRPNTDKHDLMIKSKKINNFLKDGHKVAIQIKFQGREMAHQEVGDAVWKEVLSYIDKGHCLNEPQMQGNKFIATLVPGAPKDENIAKNEENMGPSVAPQKPTKKKKTGRKF